MHPAGRALIGFWAAIAILAAGSGLVLSRLGPPGPAPESARPPPPASPPRPPAPAPAIATRSGQDIPPPDPALLEAAAEDPDRRLPMIGADGRTPSRLYAARAGLPAHGPQVAILLEGLGLSDALDQQAVDTLPAAISLGVSPYAEAFLRPGTDPLLDQARRTGHETWLCLPMEPAGSPFNSEGPRALSLAIDLDQDRKALGWALSRFQGYVGVTNALGGLRGDRFAGSSAFSMVADQLDRRGLLYLDAGIAPHDGQAVEPRDTRHADLTIDEQADDTDLAARLTRLEQIAQAQGSALGVAGPLRPVTIERLRAWSRGLGARGIALVPVSALPPARPPPPALAAPAAPNPPAPTAPLPAADQESHR